MSSRTIFLATALVLATLSALAALRLEPGLSAVIVFSAVMASALVARLTSRSNPAQEKMAEPRAVSDSSQGREAITAAALLDAIMNSMREGMILVDGSQRIVAMNPAARNIFKESDEAADARRLSDITRNPRIHEAFRAALERNERAEVKVELEGSERHTFDLRVAPLRSSLGRETHGALGIFFDITRLERLERVRQEFLSNVSHELRTPLTAIITFVETLEEGAIDDSDNNRRFLSVIRKNATRMHNLIDDILELSAIEAGTVTVEPGPLNLRSLVEDVMTSLASKAQARSVTLKNGVGHSVIVHAEARRLEQMISNLIDNGIKFNREGGSVTVSHEDSASRDRIHIRDTGEGISAEHLPRIFERFYRIDRARSHELGGTGLGLAIVKHLSRAHGGEATVHSEAGAGTTFTIELPKKRSDEP